jgi:hypothetical protein
MIPRLPQLERERRLTVLGTANPRPPFQNGSDADDFPSVVIRPDQHTEGFSSLITVMASVADEKSAISIGGLEYTADNSSLFPEIRKYTDGVSSVIEDH